MSELRVALVAEGRTDLVLIEAALKAVMRQPFVLTLLQPEETSPDMGTGWGGVFKWCEAFRQRGAATLDRDPTLSLFDLVIIHLDADVAGKCYADYGPRMVELSAGLPPLPGALPCPPILDTVRALETVLMSWLGILQLGQKAVLCIPSKSTESWLVAALFHDRQQLINRLECRLDLEERLSQLPKAERIRKSERQYREKAVAVARQWDRVTAMCTQALSFEESLKAWGHAVQFGRCATKPQSLAE